MIEIQSIDVIFNKGTLLENHVLKNLTLSIKDGEFVTIIGGNGAGKSTLMNIISGDIIPNAGHILIDKNNVTKLRTISYDQFDEFYNNFIAEVVKNSSSSTFF